MCEICHNEKWNYYTSKASIKNLKKVHHYYQSFGICTDRDQHGAVTNLPSHPVPEVSHKGNERW